MVDLTRRHKNQVDSLVKGPEIIIQSLCRRQIGRYQWKRHHT
jgi:hypothetical protein